MSDFVMVSDQHGFDPRVAVPSIAQLGLTPRNEVYLFDNGQVDIISLADALMLQNVEQCPDVFLMFMYDTRVLNADAANALYKQMCKALESSSRSHRDAKIAMFVAHSTRFMKVAARQWKSRKTASAS